jgi:hypothetical protein
VTSLLYVQGVYYFVTGIWPLVSVETFQAVTGPKTDNLITGREGDHFLLMTIGVLITAISVALLFAAWRHSDSLEATVLAVGSAVGLTGIDVIYVGRHVLPPIYLADAAAEVMLLGCWAFALMRQAQTAVRQNS